MRSALIACLLSIGLAACQDPNSAADSDAVAASESSEESSEQNEDPVMQISADHSRAMKAPPREIEFQCPTEPFAGVFVSRIVDKNLQWMRYGGGHEHGYLSLEALVYVGDKIAFIMETENTWAFDPDAPADYRDPETNSEATVDTEVQERYYYYQDGNLIESLYKKAVAHSRKGEAIESEIKHTRNKPHPYPEKHAKALARARALLAAWQADEIDSQWCGPGI